MATKAVQLEIFRARFQKLMWDLDQGNSTVEKIHTSLKNDCRELLTTTPEDK